jgi:hypothetical protein
MTLQAAFKAFVVDPEPDIVGSSVLERAYLAMMYELDTYFLFLLSAYGTISIPVGNFK